MKTASKPSTLWFGRLSCNVLQECDVLILIFLTLLPFWWCRKSTSLAPETRTRLVYALCQALKTLAAILDTEITVGDESQGTQQSLVMPQSFRDAFACHLYMLFSIMFFAESEAKIGKNLKSGSGNNKENAADSQSVNTRAACAEAMAAAARAMANNKAKLWRRSVPDEAVVVLPCRIAFQMLESATGVVARKASSTDLAIEMIASAVDSTDGVLSTIVAALMDLMHSYEHMAQLCAQLCCLVPEKPTNRLATDLLREIGRLNTNGMAGNDAGGKASGIRNVAPFIFHLAALRPRLVLNNMAHLMPHLNSEVHNLRSAIVTAIANILSKTGCSQLGGNGSGDEEESQDGLDASNRSSLLDILRERVRDVSSFTRATALKAWISLVHARSLPVEWYIPVTKLAIDRLNDKTIVVRRQSMQVRYAPRDSIQGDTVLVGFVTAADL
jgi:condensin complex subunit 1